MPRFRKQVPSISPENRYGKRRRGALVEDTACLPGQETQVGELAQKLAHTGGCFWRYHLRFYLRRALNRIRGSASRRRRIEVGGTCP